MLETISEWSIIYFKVGAILGFGIGALAQLFRGQTSRDWKLRECLIITLVWPFLFWEAAFGERNK